MVISPLFHNRYTNPIIFVDIIALDVDSNQNSVNVHGIIEVAWNVYCLFPEIIITIVPSNSHGNRT